MEKVAYLRLGCPQVTLARNRHNGPDHAQVPRFDTPPVLITRPQAQSAALADALRDVAGPFRPVISPAFELVSSGDPIPPFDAAVFTSRAGVRFAPKGAGRRAFCVGDATAAAARLAGYDPMSAAGNVADLVAMILYQSPTGSLLHIRGATSAGDVRGDLSDAGLSVQEVVAYRKEKRQPTQAAIAVLDGQADVLVPAFSAETVSIIARWRADFKAGHVIAISDAVADAAMQLSPASITVAQAPTQGEMVAATARMIA